MRHKKKPFIGITDNDEVITESDENLYFALLEKMTVCDSGRLIISLLDGTNIECEI